RSHERIPRLVLHLRVDGRFSGPIDQGSAGGVREPAVAGDQVLRLGRAGCGQAREETVDRRVVRAAGVVAVLAAMVEMAPAAGGWQDPAAAAVRICLAVTAFHLTAASSSPPGSRR